MKHKLILLIIIVLVVVAGAAVVGYARTSSKVDPSFPVGSTMAVARAHTTGTLPACLTKNASADAAVRKDDKLIDPKYQETAFDLATTMGIIDVPAGTNVDANVHSYNSKTVTGSIVYSGTYGTYNFTIVPNSPSKPYTQWKMTTLTACKLQ